MRAAGAVLRAEVAQADGRSRGFGSVLFESAESSQRAVAMFNGSVIAYHLLRFVLMQECRRYDYNGRILKVHFDKFSQTAPNGAAPNNLSSLMPSSIPPPPMQMHQQSFIPPPPFSLHFPPASAFASIPPLQSNLADRRQDSSTTDDVHQTPIAPTQNGSGNAPLGRISMPPPYPFTGGPMSPMQSRMMAQLPLMTPSMPAFTLGAYPSTPPLYPQMFSPGLGAFSPVMVGGMTPDGYPAIMNPAPGQSILPSFRLRTNFETRQAHRCIEDRAITNTKHSTTLTSRPASLSRRIPLHRKSNTTHRPLEEIPFPPLTRAEARRRLTGTSLLSMMPLYSIRHSEEMDRMRMDEEVLRRRERRTPRLKSKVETIFPRRRNSFPLARTVNSIMPSRHPPSNRSAQRFRKTRKKRTITNQPQRKRTQQPLNRSLSSRAIRSLSRDERAR